LLECLLLAAVALLLAWAWWTGGVSLLIYIDCAKDPKRSLERRLLRLREEARIIEEKLGKEEKPKNP